MTNIPMSAYHKEVIEQLHKPNLNEEKKSILMMVLNALNRLYLHGINIYPNICEIFIAFGFKKVPLYCDAISYVTKKIEEKNKKTKDSFKESLDWIRIRTVKKANKWEKGIIMCYLLFIYHDDFIEYLQNFLLDLNSNEDNVKHLILKLKGISNNSKKLDKEKILKEHENGKDKKNNEKDIKNNEKELFDINEYLSNEYFDSLDALDFDYDFENSIHN